VLYATTIAPFAAEAVRSAVADGGTVVVVEPCYEGTTALAMRAALEDRAARVVSVGVPRRFLHHYGEPEEHDAALGLDVTGLRRRLTGLLA
jgi:transketolase